VKPRYLLVKSAFARIAAVPAVQSALRERMRTGLVGICGVLTLAGGFSARSADDHRQLNVQLPRYPWVGIDSSDWVCAFEVQGELAAQGRHRAAWLPDLILAACAERQGLTVLHYDHDFDVIAQATGQDVEWVVPRGTV
jgi:predicted nucleic acid-binding protein